MKGHERKGEKKGYGGESIVVQFPRRKPAFPSCWINGFGSGVAAVRTHRHTDTVLDCTVSRLERTPTAIDLNSIIFSLARPIRWGVPDGTTKKEKEKETRRSERRTVWL